MESIGLVALVLGEWSASRKPQAASRKTFWQRNPCKIFHVSRLALHSPSRSRKTKSSQQPSEPLPISQRLAFHSPEIEATKPLITTIPRNHPRIRPRLASRAPQSLTEAAKLNHRHSPQKPSQNWLPSRSSRAVSREMRAVLAMKSLQDTPPSRGSHSTVSNRSYKTKSPQQTSETPSQIVNVSTPRKSKLQNH